MMDHTTLYNVRVQCMLHYYAGIPYTETTMQETAVC